MLASSGAYGEYKPGGTLHINALIENAVAAIAGVVEGNYR